MILLEYLWYKYLRFFSYYCIEVFFASTVICNMKTIGIIFDSQKTKEGIVIDNSVIHYTFHYYTILKHISHKSVITINYHQYMIFQIWISFAYEIKLLEVDKHLIFHGSISIKKKWTREREKKIDMYPTSLYNRISMIEYRVRSKHKNWFPRCLILKWNLKFVSKFISTWWNSVQARSENKYFDVQPRF